jgi:hypothetical protein
VDDFFVVWQGGTSLFDGERKPFGSRKMDLFPGLGIITSMT